VLVLAMAAATAYFAYYGWPVRAGATAPNVGKPANNADEPSEANGVPTKIEALELREKAASPEVEAAKGDVATLPAPIPPVEAAKPPPDPVSKSTGMTFALIAPGRFEMGSPDGEGQAEEQPRHPVTISRPFFLGVHEVTQDDYAKVVGQEKNPSKFLGEGSRPVDGVTWLDAVAFCNALSAKDGLPAYYKIDGPSVTVPDPLADGYRLPTEAEWEYACRAGRTEKFGFGDTADRAGGHAWFRDNSRVRITFQTHAVGGKEKNPWGLHDMQGNVWEWCWDRYANQYDPGEAKDPIGPAAGDHRVLRGGSYANFGSGLRCAARNHEPPDAPRSERYGFRVARTLP